MFDKLTKIAVDIFKVVLISSAENGGTFRILITAKVVEEEEEKPLLLVGNAHSRIEDGHVIAVFNPDQEILKSLVAGCAYAPGLLKQEVSGKCDAMIELWIDAYKTDGVSKISKYQARQPKPAKFEVR